MKGIITKIDKKRQSSHGGHYIRVYFKCDDNKSYRLDVYNNHTSSKRWIPYIKEQAFFSGLTIFKENIINGLCDFNYHGIKNINKNEKI